LDRVTRTKPRYAIIKVRNVAAILPTLTDLGADPEAVLRSAGIEPAMFSDPDNDLPFAAVGKLATECVKATGCESFGLRVGARRNMTSIGLTGLVSMHAPTVRDALQIISDSIRTSNTGVATMLEERGASASFQYVVTAPNIESADQIVDAAIALIVNTMRQLCGPAWRPDRVRLTRDPPRDKSPFARFFGVPVEFGALTAGVIFDAAALDRPVRDRDPDTAKILAPLLEDAIADAQGDFVSAVKSVMRARIGSGAFTRDSVCRALGLNARTLAHRLEAYGVTFSGLADEVRLDAAQSLLLKERRMAEIAAALGFAEPSAFIRAFKAWSGTTPARWRVARHGAAPTSARRRAR
jgi:AraC-like DNA-binding protein